MPGQEVILACAPSHVRLLMNAEPSPRSRTTVLTVVLQWSTWPRTVKRSGSVPSVAVTGTSLLCTAGLFQQNPWQRWHSKAKRQTKRDLENKRSMNGQMVTSVYRHLWRTKQSQDHFQSYVLLKSIRRTIQTQQSKYVADDQNTSSTYLTLT